MEQSRTCRFGCGPRPGVLHTADTVTAGGVIVLSSQCQADGSHSGIPVMSHYLSFNLTPRCFEHFDLLGIHFLACCVSL